MLNLLQAATEPFDWTSIVSNGWLMAGALAFAVVWLVKRDFTRAERIEADRDRMATITRADKPETETT